MKIASIVSIRQKLMRFVTEADEDKINSLYTILEKEIEGEASYKLTKEQYQILAEEETKYLKGEGKSYTLEEANQIARGLGDF